jgi:selenide,water dikinase
LDEPTKLLLCDAQTSGGLLMAVRPQRASRLEEALHEAGVETAAVVGEVVDRAAGGAVLEVTA